MARRGRVPRGGCVRSPALGAGGKGQECRLVGPGRAVGSYPVARGHGDLVISHTSVKRGSFSGRLRLGGRFWGVIPEVGSCRSRERDGLRPRALTRKEDLGKGVWGVGLRRFCSEHSHGLAWRPRGGRSPGVWGIHQNKARLSRTPPHPGLWGKLIPTTGLSGLRHPVREARVARCLPSAHRPHPQRPGRWAAAPGRGWAWPRPRHAAGPHLP